jgi:pSer/pThr/pTyr-binding forkhead associated (FHA) protein
VASLTIIRAPAPNQVGAVQPVNSILLCKDVILIGRDPPEVGIDLQLVEPSITRKHARITRSEEAYWIEDLNTRNGTKLNLVSVSQRTLLKDGDEIQIGSYSLLFRT